MQSKKLNEVSKMAALNASASLSKLIQQPVGVDITPATTLTAKEIPVFMSDGEPAVGIIVNLSGNINGVSFMVFPEPAAHLLCDLLLRRMEGETKKFSELEISALNEVANIVIGNFLTPFAYPFKLESLMHHAPDFKTGNFSKLSDDILKSLNHSSQDRLFVEIFINLQHHKLKGFLIFALDLEEMKKILEK